MLRCNAFARVAAGAVQASSTQHVAHLTRTLNHLSLSSKLAPVSGITNSIARSFATKVVKRKVTTKAKTKTAVKKKTPTKTKAKAKKPAAKKKTPVRKRKVTKKKVVVKPKKKVPTEKQKLAAVEAKARDELKKLKETALLHTAPKAKAESAWTIYVSEKMKGTTGATVTEVMKAASAEFKAFSASELEQYNHLANESKVANEKAYTEWVNSHTPEQIRLANNARGLLKRRVAAASPGTKRGIKGLNKIKDERQVKRISSGYLTFSVERRNSGDFKNIKLGEAAKLITAEWKALTPAETKKYTDLQEADKARYQREYQATYGHPTASQTKAAA